jgi:hemolysin activation/secretion protein
VNIELIQERFQLLQQDSRIQRINAELKPGVQRGESELAVHVTENRPLKAWLEFNNYQTPVVGAERGLATIQHHSLTGHGDVLSVTYGGSRGVHPLVNASYSIPLNAYETTFTASYRRNDFLVVAEPFRSLDIKSLAEVIGLTLMQPLYRTVSQQISISLAGEYLQNKTTLLDVPFDFVQGAKNGVANVAVIRVTPEYIYRNSTSVIAARSRFSIGIDAFDATINSGPGATGRFFSWLAQLQGVHRFDQLGGTQLIGRIDVQLSDQHLFPLEQLPVGGRYSVRGYRENSLVRDNGLLSSLEIRIPLYRSIRGEDILQLAPFLDYGRAWNSHFDTPSPRYLASAGVGLRWNILPQDQARCEVYWGQQLNHFDTGHGNLQDHGVHIQVVGQVY